MDTQDLQQAYDAALNKLSKWRAVFAGWQLGTRTQADPESQAVRDHREVTILLRAEANALVQLLIAKKVFTLAEWVNQCTIEAEHLDRAYEAKFPGFTTTPSGLSIDPQKAQETTKGWRP